MRKSKMRCVLDRVGVVVVVLVVGVAAGFGLRDTPAADASAGLTTIFSNLGTGNTVYYSAGYTVGLTPQGPGLYQWVGEAFTPTADAVVRQIDIAVKFVDGRHNAATVQLAEDHGGVPGTVLRTWNLTDLPPFLGNCCPLKTIRTEIAVHKGHQYWLIARTLTPTSETTYAWNFSNSGSGRLAVKGTFGPGWVAIPIQPGGTQPRQAAFDVLGNPSS